MIPSIHLFIYPSTQLPKVLREPQLRTPFRHLNFQKWSGAAALLAFSLQTCFVPQWRALFDLASPQMAPRPLI